MAKESQTPRTAGSNSTTSTTGSRGTSTSDRTDRSVGASSGGEMGADEFSSSAKSESSSQRSAGASSRGANSGALQETSSEPQRKSIGSIISQSLAEESQEGIDRVLSELKGYFDSGRSYIQENPREAAGLAVAAGVAAWALLGTKPGRVVFESGAAIAVPYVTKWLRGNMGSIAH